MYTPWANVKLYGMTRPIRFVENVLMGFRRDLHTLECDTVYLLTSSHCLHAVSYHIHNFTTAKLFISFVCNSHFMPTNHFYFSFMDINFMSGEPFFARIVNQTRLNIQKAEILSKYMWNDIVWTITNSGTEISIHFMPNTH